MSDKDISNYKEFDSNPDYPSVKSAIGIKSEYKDKILAYFKKYKQVVAITREMVDYISGKSLRKSVLGFTDGEYWWTSEEVYHFEKYDMKLNDDFISHVLAKTAQ